jgi:hypothetical protein
MGGVPGRVLIWAKLGGLPDTSKPLKSGGRLQQANWDYENEFPDESESLGNVI